MAVTEGLTWSGTDLNDGTNFTLRGVDFTPAPKRPEWVQGADADGAALVRYPLTDTRTVQLRIRVNPVGSLTMDQALAKVGSLVDLCEEAEKQTDGLALLWTPAQGTKSYTLYVLSGEVVDFPIEKASANSGYFLKAPMVALRLTCKPFGYGQAVDTITDDFSSDSIAKYTFDTGGGTISVTGGVLVPSSTAEKRFYRSNEGLTYCDSQVTVKVTTGASVASGSTKAISTRLDANNYLRGGVNFAGASSNLTISKIVGGVTTVLATGANFTTTAATAYWVRMRAEKNLLTVELWTSAPTATGTAAQSLTYSLAGADATLLGQGVSGQSGLALVPQATDYTWDDLQIEPNIWRSTSPLITGLVPSIAGDVAAEGRLIFIDGASQNRRHIEFGLEQRYYAAGVPTILDQFGSDTIGSGAWTVETGTGIAVSGGQLVPSDTTEKRLYRTDANYTDSTSVVKYTTGALTTSGNPGIILRRVGANSHLIGNLTTAGVLQFYKYTGSYTALGSSTTVPARAATTSYWLRVTASGNTLTLEHFTADPATGAAANQSVTHTLTGADATTWGAGVAGQGGVRLVLTATDWRLDDFRIMPLAGCTELLPDSEQLFIPGYVGTYTTRTGAYTGGTVANHVIRGSLLTQALQICATPNLGHIGTFRVKVRVYCAATNSASDVNLRLSWQEGDGPFRSNDYTQPIVNNGFSEVDLGLVSIPQATRGAQKWSGRIDAYSATAGDTLDIDYLEIIPTEIYGKGRSALSSLASGTLIAHDEFTTTTAGGNLTGRAAPLGTWTSSGAPATDFTFSDGPDSVTECVTRAATADASPKFSVITASITDTDFTFDFYSSTNAFTTNINPGCVLRYVDTSNYAAVYFSKTSFGPTKYLLVLKTVVAGALVSSPTLITRQLPVNTWQRIRVVVTASGQVTAQWLDTSGNLLASGSTSDSGLAPGGALASGKAGLYDFNSGGAYSRYWDNILVSGNPVEPIVIYSGFAAEVNHEGQAQRQDSTGSSYGRVPLYRGGRILQPSAGSANRTTRVVGKVRRNDVDVAQDDQVADAAWMQLKYTPRYRVIPR